MRHTHAAQAVITQAIGFLRGELDAKRGARGAAMTKYIDENSAYGANGTFFRVIRDGLEGLVDGEDYFDMLADDVVFE